MKYKRLNEVALIINETVDTSSMSSGHYVSTENMLANREGIISASKLPKMRNIKGFKKNDVLFSNIRPYFKKIWFAEYDGACSNDVLVFRATTEVVPRYLYYLLSSDAFFAFATATSKGTKMPRGDRNAMMQYMLPIPSIVNQEKIADCLSTLDYKILTNKQINHHFVLCVY